MPLLVGMIVLLGRSSEAADTMVCTTSAADCDAGQICVTEGPTYVGTCKPLCQPEACNDLCACSDGKTCAEGSCALPATDSLARRIRIALAYLRGLAHATVQSFFGYRSSPSFTITLGSSAPGASPTLEVVSDIPAGSLEPYETVLTYPSEFTFNGFPGPPNTVIGEYAIDIDLDGNPELVIFLRTNDPNTAYADRQGNGVFSLGDPTMVHTVGSATGAHLFSIVTPLGGDGNNNTTVVPLSFRATLRLDAGIVTNPTTPGTYTLRGDFTSVDPDTDDFDDGAGEPPQHFSVESDVTITLCASSPRDGCIVPGKAVLVIDERKVGKEKLKTVLRKMVPAVARSQFGNPVTGSTSYEVCIYDDADTLVGRMTVARAGDRCGRRPCWRMGWDWYRYSDKDLAADGIQKIFAEGGGAGKGKLIVRGKNNLPGGHVSLPTGIAASLAGNTAATVQVMSSDASCFGVTTTKITVADGVRFRGSTP